MFKAIKRIITSGLKPHSCKFCNNCYVCHECLREKNQIRQCCFGVTDEELDVLHEELRNNFSLLFPVRKHSNNLGTNLPQSENPEGTNLPQFENLDDSKNCCMNSMDWNNFQCNICEKVFKTEFTLTRHFNTHAKVGERFKCHTCNKCFAINKDLQIHSKIHRKVVNKSRICKFCKKDFPSLYYLKKHICQHKGEKPFKCELCHNVYTTQTMLNIHYRTHVSKRNVQEESYTNELTDSEVEALDDENDSFDEQSFDLKNFEHEKLNSGMPDNQDFITNFDSHFNLEDDFNVSQKNFVLSLGKGTDLETSFEEDINVKKSYKAPLVIKLKSSS